MTLPLHVLPVGRSLLARAEDANRPSLRPLVTALHPQSFEPATNPDLKVADELAQKVTGDRLHVDAVLTTEHRALVHAAESDACAEWTSVARAAGASPEPAAAYLLIASDTDDGLRSAVLVAARYAAHRGVDHVRYLHDPSQARHTRINPGEVWIARVPGLDFTADSIPDATWYALGSIGHIIQRTGCTAVPGNPASWAVTLHLTGGYKGMLPYLLIMAEGIKTVLRNKQSVPGGRNPTITALSVHEHDRDVPIMQRKLIELPVRWLRGDALDALRKLTTYTKANPGTGFSDKWVSWQGQWITDGGGRLSSAGMILTRVL